MASAPALSYKGHVFKATWLSSKEAAVLLGCTSVTITSYCRRNLLVARQVLARNRTLTWQIKANCIHVLLNRAKPDPEWISVFDAAELLACSPAYIFNQCANGLFETRRVPGRLPGSLSHLEVKASSVHIRAAERAQLGLVGSYNAHAAARAAGVSHAIIVRLFRADILDGTCGPDGKIAINAASLALYQRERNAPDYWTGERLQRYQHAQLKRIARIA